MLMASWSVMARPVVLALLLLAAPGARAEARLDVVDDQGERFFDLTVVTATRTEHCTLPAPGGCALSLSPGPLHLRVQSGGRSRELDDTLPDRPMDLILGYRSPAMGYAGLGVIGGGAVFAGLTVALAVSFADSASSAVDTRIVDAFFMTFTSVLGLALFIAGGVLTGIGFGRAGPTLDLSVPEAPPGALPAALPEPQPPAPAAPGSSGWTSGAPSP